MAKQRRAYSEEFKRDAVRRLAAGDHALSYIARELGIHPNLLGTWLRRENASLKEDREILKKAAAFFAKESR